MRDLTIEGKIVILNSLAISKNACLTLIKTAYCYSNKKELNLARGKNKNKTFCPI